jgi:beta-glucosidase
VFRDARGAPGLLAFLAPTYGLSSPLKALQAARPDAQVVFDDGSDPARAAAVARSADVAFVFAVKPQTEGSDARDLSLPDRQDALIAAVAEANPRTGVVLETGGPVSMPWLGSVKAVLEAWYPGQRGGEAIAAVLNGDAAPAGRLPITFPADLAQTPRPKLDGFDPSRPSGLFDPPPAPFAVDYREGSDVGYRWFEKTGAKPLFPFGYGLTYTHFSYGGLQATGGRSLTVRFRISNQGDRAGVEVAQLYVGPPGRTHRLAGWSRVELKPGESREVTITADPRLLASYDMAAGGWARAAGVYDVEVGKSAGEPQLRAQVTLVGEPPAAAREGGR